MSSPQRMARSTSVALLLGVALAGCGSSANVPAPSPSAAVRRIRAVHARPDAVADPNPGRDRSPNGHADPRADSAADR